MNESTTTQLKDTTANPAPLGLLGFGMTTVLLNLHGAGFYDLNSMILAMGICYGGAAQLAINCDIRICSDDARFRFVAANYGMPACGAILPRIVGEAKAKEILFTADVVHAEEALRCGLANQVVPGAEVIDVAVAMGERIAGNSPFAVRALKEIIDEALPVEEALALEGERVRELRSTSYTEARFRAAAAKVTGN